MTTDIDLNPENLEGLELQPTAKGQPFNWLKQWYPVSPLSYLDDSCPTPITLLGKNLVIWQHQGQWIAMDDVCPHKLTQLSLGKVQVDGTLVCRQHGWCFDQQGQCVQNPMLPAQLDQPAAYHNVRSHVTTYPTQVEQGLLWIWPDRNDRAFADCQQKQPATLPKTSPKWNKTDWHMIEVPLGYTVSIENSFDPVHAQFLHEGIGTFSPANAIPMQGFELLGELSAEEGFVLSHKGYNTFNREMEATRTFRPPCANITQYYLPTGGVQTFQLYFVPTAPGHCRYIMKFVMDLEFPARPLSLIQWMNKKMLGLLPEYVQVGLQHLGTYKLNDQDITAMYAQERNEAVIDMGRRRSPFLPSPADQGTLTLKNWLNRFGNGGPEPNSLYAERVESRSNEQLYDRWHRHTKLCPSCRRSVEWIAEVQRMCHFMTTMMAILGGIMLLLPLTTRPSLGCFAIAILSLLGHQGLTKLHSHFMSSIPGQGIPSVRLWPTGSARNL